MAGETLKTASELLDSFPDNVVGLIDAVDDRSFVVSVAVAVGFVEDDPLTVPYTIPMTNGVPVDFMSTLTTPGFFGNFWKLDGNNAFVPSYSDFGITVPAGSFRLLSGTVLLNCEKVGGGTGVFEFQGTANGLFIGDPVQRELTSTAETLIFSGTRLVDVSLAEAQSFDITPVGHSDDLQINDVRVVLEGTML